MSAQSGWARIRALVIGQPRDLTDRSLFHRVSLIAVLAWVGLGADGLSSSCYGPEETYKALGAYPALAIFVALGCVTTIAVICASYRQIIELFPTGGGGYLVASKLLSPTAGLVSGSALLVDYVLTITISIASGADALFSLLPPQYQSWKLPAACTGVVALTLLNLRGVRESVIVLAPVFFLFVFTHAVAILFVLGSHMADFGGVARETSAELSRAHSELGLLGIAALMLRAFSVGAGTYTGIEAVSNGIPVLREPRVQTGKRTMTYMGVSLAVTVFGLLLAYLVVRVQPVEGKTLNAVLFEAMTARWPHWVGSAFVFVALGSATALLFIAAQAGFVDGPRVLASMALDRWFPSRFATLSDRFVSQNGIVLMSGGAMVALLLTRGAVGLLVVLYSINVFLTFSMSQLGMVVHWWKHRGTEPAWRRKLAVNGIGLCLTSFILITLCAVKFQEGGWVTLVLTATVIGVAALIKRHYAFAARQLRRLDELVTAAVADPAADSASTRLRENQGRTAIVLVNGYNGLGLHTLYGIFRMFPGSFGRFIFVQVGSVDAGTFKGAAELDHLRQATEEDAGKYADLCRRYGLQASCVTTISADLVPTIEQVVTDLLKQNPGAVVFGGQLAFARETLWTRLLHNYLVFAVQALLCRRGIPFVIVPARV